MHWTKVWFCSVATPTRVDGGILHIHGNVNDTDEARWLDNVVESISSIATTHGTRTEICYHASLILFEILICTFARHDCHCVSGLSWKVSLEHVERVKWYGPHIRHVVVDVRCRPNWQSKKKNSWRRSFCAWGFWIVMKGSTVISCGGSPCCSQGRTTEQWKICCYVFVFLDCVYQRIKLCCNPRRRIRRHILVLNSSVIFTSNGLDIFNTNLFLSFRCVVPVSQMGAMLVSCCRAGRQR
jgi:hypothetical protein